MIRPGACSIKHCRLVIYRVCNKLVYLSKHMIVTDNNKNNSLHCNMLFFVNYKSVMSYCCDCTVVEHLPYYPKAKGYNPATAAGTKRELNGEKMSEKVEGSTIF